MAFVGCSTKLFRTICASCFLASLLVRCRLISIWCSFIFFFSAFKHSTNLKTNGIQIYELDRRNATHFIVFVLLCVVWNHQFEYGNEASLNEKWMPIMRPDTQQICPYCCSILHDVQTQACINLVNDFIFILFFSSLSFHSLFKWICFFSPLEEAKKHKNRRRRRRTSVLFRFVFLFLAFLCRICIKCSLSQGFDECGIFHSGCQ